MASDSLIRAKPNAPSMAVNAKSVGIVIAVLALIIAGTFASPFGSGEGAGASSRKQRVASTGSEIARLPRDYSEIRVSPTLAPQVETRQAIEQPKGLSDIEKLRAELAKKRLAAAVQARGAGVTFGGLSVAGLKNGALDSAAALLGRGAESSRGAGKDSATDKLNPRDSANRQDEKENFLSKDQSDEVYVNHRLISPRSKYQLMAGTVIPGVLITGINSDLPGQILGQVSQNVFDTVQGRYLLLPQGTKAIGRYDSRVAYGQERVLVAWHRLIFPNGKSIQLGSMSGTDMSGYSGLSDQVNNHYLKLFTGVILSSLLGAGAQLAQGPTYQTVNPDYGQLASQGIAQNTNQVGQELTRRNLDVQPTLEIRPGFRFNIFVNKDMILEPYAEN